MVDKKKEVLKVAVQADVDVVGSKNLSKEIDKFGRELQRQLAKYGTVNLGKMLKGSKSGAKSLSDVIDAIDTELAADLEAEGEGLTKRQKRKLQNLNRTLRGMESRVQALAGLEISGRQAKRIKQLGTAAGAEKFSSYGAKTREKTSRLLSSTKESATIAKEIANAFIRNPATKELGLALSSQVKALLADVARAEKNISPEARTKAAEAKQKRFEKARKKVGENVVDVTTRAFFEDRFRKLKDKKFSDLTAAEVADINKTFKLREKSLNRALSGAASRGDSSEVGRFQNELKDLFEFKRAFTEFREKALNDIRVAEEAAKKERQAREKQKREYAARYSEAEKAIGKKAKDETAAAKQAQKDLDAQQKRDEEDYQRREKAIADGRVSREKAEEAARKAKERRVRRVAAREAFESTKAGESARLLQGVFGTSDVSAITDQRLASASKYDKGVIRSSLQREPKRIEQRMKDLLSAQGSAAKNTPLYKKLEASLADANNALQTFEKRLEAINASMPKGKDNGLTREAKRQVEEAALADARKAADKVTGQKKRLGELTNSEFNTLKELRRLELKRAQDVFSAAKQRSLADPTDSLAALEAGIREIERNDAKAALRDLSLAREKDIKAINEETAARRKAEADKKALDKEEDARVKQRRSVLEKASKRFTDLQDKYDARQFELTDVFARKGVNPGDFAGLDRAGFSGLSGRELGQISSLIKQRRELLKAERETINARAGADGFMSQGDASRLNEINRSLEEHKRQLRDVNAAYTALETPLGQASRLLRQFFRYALGYGALYEVLTFIAYLTRGVVALNRELFSIQAIAGTTAKSMEGVSNAIRKTASDTKFSVEEVAGAAKILVQAGVEIKDLPKALEAATVFAAGTDTSIETAADLLSTVRDVYKELDDSTIANQLTRAINISKLTGEDMKTILSLSAQTAEGLNLSSEQYLAAVSTLRNAGIKASTVATGLRQALLEIFNPDEKTLKAFQKRYEKVGEVLSQQDILQRFYSFKNSDNPLVNALSELKRLGFGGEDQKNLQRVFDVRAVNAIQALISNFEELEASAARITLGRAAFEASEVQMQSLSASIENLGGAMTILASNVLEGPVSALEQLADWATRAVNSINDLDTTLKARGEKGLQGSFTPGVAGAVIGGSLGGATRAGLGGAALGGLGGFIAGVTANTAAQESRASGETSTTAIVSNAAIAIGGILAVWNILKVLATSIKGANKELFLVGGRSAGFSTAAGAVLKAFPLGRIFSIVISLVGVISAIATFFKSSSEKASGTQELANRVQAAQRELDAYNNKAGFYNDLIDSYNVTDKSKAGTSAATGQQLRDSSKKVNDAIAQYFGDVVEINGTRVFDLLKEYRNATDRDVRKQRFAELAAFSTQLTEKGFEALDFELSQLSGNISNYSEGAASVLKDLGEQAVKALEVVQREGVDKNSEQYLAAETFLKGFKDATSGEAGATVRDAAFGLTELTADEATKGILSIFSSVEKAVREAKDGMLDVSGKIDSATGERTKQLDKYRLKIRAEIEKAIADSGGDLDNLRLALRGLMLTINEVSNESIRLIDAKQKAIKEEMVRPAVQAGFKRDAAKQEFDELDRIIKNAEAGGPVSANALPRDFYAKREAAAARLKAAQDEYDRAYAASGVGRQEIGTLDVLRQQIFDKAEADRARRAASAGDLLAGLPELMKKPEFVEAVKATNNSVLLGMIERLAKNPDDIKNIIAESKAKFTLDGADVKTDPLLDTALEKLSSSKDASSKSSILNSQIERKNIAISQERDRQRLAELDEEIRTIQTYGRGKLSDKYHLLSQDGPNNLYRIRAQVQERLLEGDIRALEIEIAQIEGNQNRSGEKEIELEQKRIQLEALKKSNAKRTLEELQRAYDTSERFNIDKDKELFGIRVEALKKSVLDAGSTLDVAAFDGFMADYDRYLKEYQDALRRELELKDRNGELQKEEYELQKKIIENMRDDPEKFAEYVDLFITRLRALGDALLQTPLTSGNPATDAKFDRVGGVQTDASRLRQLDAQREGAGYKVATASLEKSKQQKALDDLKASGLADTDPRVTQAREILLVATNQLTAAEQELARIEDQRVQITNTLGDEIKEAFDFESLAAKLRASQYSVENLSENLQDGMVQGIDSLGDALADAALGTGNFKESLRSLVNEFATDQLKTLIKTGLNSLFESIFSSAAAKDAGGGLGGILGGILGGGGSEGGVISEDGATKPGGGITGMIGQLFSSFGTFFASLFGLQSATSATQAATTTAAATTSSAALIGAAGALTGAAGALAASAAAGAGSSALQAGASALMLASTGAMAKKGRLIPSYAGGGLLRGPGTPTSDSILGFLKTPYGNKPVALSDREAVLNAKATSFLGEGTIHALNKGKFRAMATGGMIGAYRPNANAETGPGLTGGGAKGSQAGAKTTIVNAMDSASFFESGLKTPVGGKALVNYVRANRSAVKAALGL